MQEGREAEKKETLNAFAFRVMLHYLLGGRVASGAASTSLKP